MEGRRQKRKILTDEEIQEEFRLIPSSDIEPDYDDDDLPVEESDDENEVDHIEYPDSDDTDADPEYEPSSEEENDDNILDDDLEPAETDEMIKQVLASQSLPSTSQPSTSQTASRPQKTKKKGYYPKQSKENKNRRKTTHLDGSEENLSSPFERVIKFESPKVTGKNGYEWETSPVHPLSGKPRPKNIIYSRPGTLGNAVNSKTPVECFTTLFSDGMVELVERHTNEEILRQRSHYNKKEHSALRNVSSVEMKCLIGVLIMAAGLRDNHLSVRTMMNLHLSGEKYHAAFSRSRFEFLLNGLCFDDKNTRAERAAVSKIAPVSELWSNLITNCTENYRPGSYLTIDEQLVGFRGKCPFRVYMPAKPNKYGVKIFMMCDVSTKYMVDAIIYQGKGSTPSDVPQAEYIVLQLVESVKGTNRNVTFDNWFSSVPLAEKMLNEKKTTVIGTLRKNKRHLPGDFTNPKFMRRREGTSLFLFTKDMSVVSYKPEKKHNKLVVLISTAHDSSHIDPNSGKPEIVMNYNATKGAVDTFDQICQNMNANRKTQRWPMCIFYNIINIAVHNSYVIYLNNFYKNNGGGKPLSRFDYVMTLAQEMITPWMHERLTLQIPKTLRVTISSFLGLPHPHNVEPERRLAACGAGDGKKHYCSFCCYKKKRMTRFSCTLCIKFICGEHTHKFCQECAGKKISA